MRVWISRDDDPGVMDSINIWDVAPGKRYDSGKFYHPIFDQSGWQIMSAKDFDDAFGFVPEKGSCIIYELKLERLE